jgi:hypothetical protein
MSAIRPPRQSGELGLSANGLEENVSVKTKMTDAEVKAAFAAIAARLGDRMPKGVILAACRTEVWNFAAVLFFGCARSFFHLNGR